MSCETLLSLLGTRSSLVLENTIQRDAIWTSRDSKSVIISAQLKNIGAYFRAIYYLLHCFVYIYWKGTVYDTYTYIGRTGPSTVDYVISTPHLFDYVSHFSVHDPNILLDHCVISYCFTFDCQYDHVLSDAPKDTVYDSVNYRYVLNSDKSHDFQVKLTSPDTMQKLIFF